MILIDTNVLLAFLDPSDDNHEAARRAAHDMRKAGLLLVLPVLAEVTHFLDSPHLYDRLEKVLSALDVRFERSEHLVDQAAALKWLKQYATHDPDYADAHLVMLTAANKRYRVWSFDHEFRDIWRRPDGSAVPMAVR